MPDIHHSPVYSDNVQDSLQMLWLTAYLMGLPPTGLYIPPCWTHGQTPPGSACSTQLICNVVNETDNPAGNLPDCTKMIMTQNLADL